MAKFEFVVGRSVSLACRAVAALMLLAGIAFSQSSFPRTPGIWLSGETGHRLSDSRKDQLEQSLRRITGLNELRFADNGSLVTGAESPASMAVEGSATARRILSCALGSGYVFIIEDHSDSPSVNFGQLDEGLRYEDATTGMKLLIWRVRLDFNDFHKMQAPREVRRSFDAGFTMLHEILHGLGYKDAATSGELGECEETVNGARAELGLPLRDQYFGDTLQMARRFVSVRLRFRSGERRVSAGSARGRTHYLFFLLPSGYEQQTAPAGVATFDCAKKR